MSVDEGRNPSVIIIGAGMSGLCLAIQLREAGFTSITLLEKSPEVGGTWLDNSYPNAGCDVPSFLYSFSFAPNHEWSMKYARQPEILDYLKNCADHFDVRRLIRFGTAVKSAKYDEQATSWKVQTESGEELVADILVSAVGQLNRPQIPDIPGIDEFQGQAWHSARWNHQYDLTGKTVAIIGNGASAIQFVPEVAKLAARIHLFQRTPSWIHPLNNYRYPAWAKWCFRNVPYASKLHRLWIFLMCEWRIIAFREGSLANRIYRWWLKRQMKKHIPESLRETLIPDYAPGCKRILLSSNFLQTVTQEKVEIITEPVASLSRDSVCTDSRSVRVDAVIFGTGFDSVGFLQPMQIVGRNSAELHESWAQRPRTLLGVATPGFPNFFLLYGPNTNLGHNSIIFMVEQQVRYIIQCLQRMKQQRCTEVEVTAAAVEDYDKDVQERLATSVWAGDCSNWYKSADGVIVNNWWGSAGAYARQMREPDFSAFHFR